MSFHPNDVARRARTASFITAGIIGLLIAAFFRTQVLDQARYALQSEENRLREVPLPAPRGIIYDRNGLIIAENVPGYSVSILSPSADSLRTSLERLSGTISLSKEDIDIALRRYKRAPNRPTVVLADAKFDVVSVLEEHRVEFPGLIIQAAPKRFYPDSSAVASIVGYTGEITEDELKKPAYQNYKSGQQVGKGGLERYYEPVLRGREGTRFVEVDARGRVVREAGARQDIEPLGAEPLQTNIDLKLQEFVANIFGDSLQGGVVALDPTTGGVLALYSAPSFNPNRFVGGIPADYWRELTTDPRHPLYNKAIQGTYPPGSTWKLATAVLGLEAGQVSMKQHMPTPCTGGYQYFNRYFKCWDHRGHGNLDLQGAIEKSCDVYFYQLGLTLGLEKLIAGGVSLKFRERTDIDLPSETRPLFPDAIRYYDERYGPRRWSRAVTLNLAIGQGENDQTVVNMARFYTALATDGRAAQPMIVKGNPKRERIFSLSPDQMEGLRTAMAGVVAEGGTAAASRINGVILAGKTGSAQNAQDVTRDHAWFVGFAPADNPKIVVAVMLEFGLHGSRAARIASAIVAQYLHQQATSLIQTEG